METKKDVIEERSKEVGDVYLDNYDDDGAYIHLVYSTKICTDDMSELLSNMEQIYCEMEGATDITSNLYTIVSYVKDLFAEWVDDIDIEIAKAKQGFLSLIEPRIFFGHLIIQQSWKMYM